MKKNIMTLVLFFIAGCSLEPVVIDPDTLGDYYVFCTLDPAGSFHNVLVGRSLPEKMPVPVTDAFVSISGGDRSVALTHTNNGIYIDRNNELDIKTEGHYSLTVSLDGKKIVSGETRVPGDFNVLCPLKGDTLEVVYTVFNDTLGRPVIKWTPSANAYYYHVLLELPNMEHLIGGSEHSTFRTNMYLPEIRKRGGSTSENKLQSDTLVTATISVVAIDSTFGFLPINVRTSYSFIDFTREEEKENTWLRFYPFTYDQDKMKLTGANGVFSSICTRKVDFYLNIKINNESILK